jgi:hypothetical protein
MIKPLEKFDTPTLEMLKIHWLKVKEDSLKAVAKAEKTLEQIENAINASKPPELRLEELKAVNGVEYQTLEENANYN